MHVEMGKLSVRPQPLRRGERRWPVGRTPNSLKSHRCPSSFAFLWSRAPFSLQRTSSNPCWAGEDVANSEFLDQGLGGGGQAPRGLRGATSPAVCDWSDLTSPRYLPIGLT